MASERYPVEDHGPSHPAPGGDEDEFLAQYERWLREQPCGYEKQPQVISDLRKLKTKLPDPAEQVLPAAEAYGVAPTTLARMLVRRGVEAILRPQARGPSG